MNINQDQKAIAPVLLSVMICFLIASTWSLIYLIRTTYGYGVIAFLPRMIEYVIGTEKGIDSSAIEPLFIIVTRFLLILGFGWLPITFAIDAKRNKLSRESKIS